MSGTGDNLPRPEEVEKEISDYLSRRFGDKVKIVSAALPEEDGARRDKTSAPRKKNIDFNLKPADLKRFLDRYIVRQDRAKEILSTKICTHYNRAARAGREGGAREQPVGGVKNNVLILGPTGVGKTYMIRLIAKRLGVPFVKGDATKFSETGYVGGDVEDLVRDLVREADGDLELAQYGIIYIDEIDKIASSGNVVGLDVSRTGVQRALLKPMEETEVELKVPHDPMSMMREMERMRREGAGAPRSVSTKNILFIMSGAFSTLSRLIRERVETQGIGFSACVKSGREDASANYLSRVRAEDLVRYGFESEFIGRLPITAVLSPLSPSDLLEILKNPGNPIVLGKKLDFAAYGIDAVFSEEALALIAQNAALENTGARGLVSAMERALMGFEHALPSTAIRRLAVTAELVRDPEKALADLLARPDEPARASEFAAAKAAERDRVAAFFTCRAADLAEKAGVKLTPARAILAADLYTQNPADPEIVVRDLKERIEAVKKLEIRFLKDHDIDLVLDDDAVDLLVPAGDPEESYRRLTADFEYGLKLVKEKTGASRFVLSAADLADPEGHVKKLLTAKE